MTQPNKEYPSLINQLIITGAPVVLLDAEALFHPHNGGIDVKHATAKVT